MLATKVNLTAGILTTNLARAIDCHAPLGRCQPV